MSLLGDKQARRTSGTGIPASALAPDDPAAPARTQLAEARFSVRRGELVELPGLGRAYIELVGHMASNAVEAETFKVMAEIGLPPLAIHAWSYDMQRYARTLAIAARHPERRDEKYGSLDQWLAEDDDVIFACSRVYQDVKNRLDPTSPDSTITEENRARLVEAFKKKEVSLLRSFGVVTLTNWLLSGDVQLSTSPTPSSDTGEPSPAK